MKAVVALIVLGAAAMTMNVQAADTDSQDGTNAAIQLSDATTAQNSLEHSTLGRQDSVEPSHVDAAATSVESPDIESYQIPLSDYSNGGYF